MIYNSKPKKQIPLLNKTTNNVKKEYLKNNTSFNFDSKKKIFINTTDRITTDFLINNKKPTFLYYLYTLRKRELESKKKFNNSFLTQFKNSYRWTHFFLQKINCSILRKFYIAKKPFFKNGSYGRYINNKYLNNIPLLWVAKNLYWKLPIYKIHELLGVQNKTFKKNYFTQNISTQKLLTNNLMECRDMLKVSKQNSFSFFFKIKQKQILKPYSFMLVLNDITSNIGFLNYYSYINFYEKNKLVSKRSLKFPLNYLISKKYPSFMIVNYTLFSFCITKDFITTPSYQLRVFLKNFIYYPIWYKSSFIY